MMMSGSFLTASERYRGTEKKAATPEPLSPQAADLVRGEVWEMASRIDAWVEQLSL